MKKNKTKNIWIGIIIILTVVVLYFWRSGGNGDIASLGLGKAVEYKTEGSDFAFSYPEKLSVTETPIEDEAGKQVGKKILVEGVEKGKGFEITVLPFDEDIVLTKERILQDLPDMIIEGEKEVSVGSGIKALAFNSEDSDIGGTAEIWFVNKGFIYEARTYKDFGVSMQEILNTIRFK